MSNEFTRDFSKKDLGIGELSPGSTPRRYEPEGGVKKHNERIHRESKYVDEHKNLSFKFSKPKSPGRQKYVRCNGCSSISRTSINTVGIICDHCHNYCGVEDIEE